MTQLRDGENSQTMLLNYRKRGEPFENLLTMAVRRAGFESHSASEVAQARTVYLVCMLWLTWFPTSPVTVRERLAGKAPLLHRPSI